MVPNDSTITTNEATKAAEAAKPKVLANIVRGVMPVALVARIKFDEKGIEKDADVAKLYGTTSGKVNDIRKGRNFGYLTDAFVPTAEQKKAAIEWMKRVPDYAAGQDAVVSAIERTPDATAEQAAAFLAGRTSLRVKTVKTPKEPKAEGAQPVEAQTPEQKKQKGKDLLK